MNRSLFAASLAGAFTLLLTGPSAAANLSVRSNAQPSEWVVEFKGRPVMVYASSPGKYKPYIRELHTLRGDNVLLDAPSDHLHHHALMYGIRVNGVNFWEELSNAGVQKPVSTTPPKVLPSSGSRHRAQLQQVLHWLPAQDAFLHNTAAAALLVEQRTITLSVDEKTSEVAVYWRSRFEVGARTNEVVLTGANYHGLGMRFLRELDPSAKHLHAGGAPDLADNRQDVSPHAWGSVVFETASGKAHIACFGDPGNARGPATFFSMRTPFAYLSATQALDREPLVYKQGQTFEVNYLMTLYPEEKGAEFLNGRSAAWAKEEKP